MAGHSKWANIKHKKGKEDAKRGKLFTKLIREIVVAAKLGGGDVSSNPRLRDAVAKALAGNMTRDTIDRAVKRGAGDQDGADMEDMRYEGYGPAGVAVMVDCLTDNRNRTVAEVRHAFSKSGGNLGTDGSVAYLFEKQGQLHFDSDVDEDKLMEVALEAGADDVQTNDDGSASVITAPEDFAAVQEAMQAADLTPAHADIVMQASTAVDIADQDTAEKFMRLVDMLEDLDDVQTVSSNADISDDVLAKLS
ncbi:MAG: putative transcriptional regulatory protein [marine bacterium B5-7]|nr:MAG: putative transcriptional regulatory protein [marine bacterium B5-7]